MRTATIKRTTKETDIDLFLNLDGEGISTVDTGCGFLDHMLTLFSKHGHFDLTVKCKGDVNVDYHHSVEDIGICLGQAVGIALGECLGINRYGYRILPMDDALIMCAIDISGRAYLNFDVQMPTEKVGDFDTELVKEFMYGFVRNAKITLHVKKFYGENTHHVIEGAFKCLARALDEATAINPRYADEIVSTKGTL